MHSAFLQTDEDVQWLLATHLKGVPLPAKYARPGFAIVQGNEDSPHAVNLYVARVPTLRDDYLRVRFVHENGVYCEYVEHDGNDQPKWTPVSRPTNG